MRCGVFECLYLFSTIYPFNYSMQSIKRGAQHYWTYWRLVVYGTISLFVCYIKWLIWALKTNISMVTYLTNTIWKALKKLTWLVQVVHSGTPCPHHYWWHLSLGLGASEPSYPRYLLEDFSRNLPLPLLESYPLHWDIFAAEIKVSANPNKPNQNETMSFINIIVKINTIWEFIFKLLS